MIIVPMHLLVLVQPLGFSVPFLAFPIIDKITALIVGFIIIKTAIEIFWEAVQTLTDGFDIDEAETLWF